MNIDYPLHFDARGRTARTDHADHVAEMVEQLLFTSPGERVNRPDFGVGLKRLCFEGNSPVVATAVAFSVQAALQRYLGTVIEVRKVQGISEDATLQLGVSYQLRRTGEVVQEPFPRRPQS